MVFPGSGLEFLNWKHAVMDIYNVVNPLPPPPKKWGWLMIIPPIEIVIFVRDSVVALGLPH